ncbi:MAG TPA: metallophosphoesterase [Chthoniobacteraceae bacterium]|nr:metallophosphoesterase [Chthoniobacteraceae bacterium]
MKERKTIAVLGDFHLKAGELELSGDAMDDLRREAPDLVVPLGDFGPGGEIGTPRGLEQAWELLSRIGAPLRPILGNHDLQVETGGKQEPGTMEKRLCELAGLEASCGFVEYDRFRLLFVTTEYQPEETCWSVQECYVSDRQFETLRRGLAERPGVPVIVFSHAPPIGARLRTHPRTHPRATNAYLEQNHDPFRWRQLYREHPEIVVWFSAHYHIGHDHPDSHTEAFGTHFFHTQVHGSATRDSERQSRFLEITPERFAVSTIDHRARRRRETPDWVVEGGLDALVEAKRHWREPEAVCGTPIAIDGSPIMQLLPLPGQRALVATEEGFLWEIDLPTGGMMGCHHHGGRLDAVVLSGTNVWRAWGGSLAVADLTSLTRFIRNGHDRPEDHVGWSFPKPIRSLLPWENGRVLVLTGGGEGQPGGAVWEVAPDVADPTRRFEITGKIPVALSRTDGGFVVQTAGGMLLFCPPAGR